MKLYRRSFSDLSASSFNAEVTDNKFRLFEIYVARRYFLHCLRAIKNKITTGVIIPISLGIVLFVDSSMSIKRIPQTINVAKIAPKLNSETFKNLTLIGTKKNIITTAHGTKNGYTKILYNAPLILLVSTPCLSSSTTASIASPMVKLTFLHIFDPTFLDGTLLKSSTLFQQIYQYLVIQDPYFQV